MTKSAIFSVFLSKAIAGTPYGESRMNEECVDLILGKLCNEQCVGYLVDCVSKCDNDSVCIANCGREESKPWVLKDYPYTFFVFSLDDPEIAKK